MSTIGIHRKTRLSFASGLFLVVLFLAPFVILGPDVFVDPHDHLDSDIVWYTIIGKSDLLHSIDNEAQVEQIMNGIPRNSMPSGFTFVSLLFSLFAPYTAFAINYILVRLIGFLGMFAFLKRYVFADKPLLTALVSVGFALLPFFGTHAGVSVSGIPLLLWALLQFVSGQKRAIPILVMVLYSFYSSLIYTGVFLLIVFGMAWLWLVIKRDKRQWPLLGSILILTLCLSISELHLFNQMLFSDFESHRSEWFKEGVSWKAAPYVAGHLFLFGHYHAASFNFPFILLAVLLTGFSILLRRSNIAAVDKNDLKWFGLGLLAIAIICGIHGVYDTTFAVELRRRFKLLSILQWNRFYWLLPVIWSVILALSIKISIGLHKRYGYLAAIVLLGGQIAFTVTSNAELKTNFLRVLNLEGQAQASFKGYYAQALFDKIKQDLQAPIASLRFVSVGLDAEIAAFNGLYTLDSYQRNYDLNYKHQFRRIIAPELDRNEKLKAYFDHWGSKCYAFSAELHKSPSAPEIQRIDFDLNAFRSMGGTHILSSKPIGEFTGGEVAFVKKYTDLDSSWEVYLYEVKG